jgi:hypothetical protein
MAAIDTLKKYQSELRQMRQEESRLQGMMDATMQQLKKEFKVDSLDAANKLLQGYERNEKNAAEAYKKALEKVEKVYASI